MANIGYSALAASFMALYIDWQNGVTEAKRIQQIKTSYLRDVNDEIVMLIGRAVWFFRQLSNENFDWSNTVESYCLPRYAKQFGQGIGEKQVISVDDAKKEIDKYICDYGLDKFKHDGSLQSKKIEKLFQILAYSAKHLQTQILDIKKNTLLLALQKTVSVDECKKIIFEAGLAIDMMRSQRGYYTTGLNHLFDLEEIVRKEGGFANVISVWLQFTCTIDEL